MIFKGHVSSSGWWKRFLWNAKAACWKTEKPTVGRLNGKLKRVQFWILCDVVLLCVCSSKYDFRLELKKFCLSTSIYQHDSCSSCVMCTGVCWLAILIPISFKQMAFFCHYVLFPQLPWQGVFLAALLSLLMIIFSWCLRAKFRCLFLTSNVRPIFSEKYKNSYHAGICAGLMGDMCLGPMCGWICRETHGPSIRWDGLRLWHRNQQLRFGIECLAQEPGFFVAWIQKSNCRKPKKAQTSEKNGPRNLTLD